VTAADSADGETCSRSAAPLMVPASATATNAASWFIVNAGTPSALATQVTLAREPDTSQQGAETGGFIWVRGSRHPVRLPIQPARTNSDGHLPAGQWVYSVTPVIGANWQGPESVRSVAATVATPTLALSPTAVKPGSSLIGTMAGFLGGETLRYRLDSPGGAPPR
jgi:hypothetical protein